MILLARHGETDDNRPPLRFQGRRDTPLNDTGRRQAGELAEQLRGEEIDSLWCSDLSRARETAEIVSAALDLGDPRIDERLSEGRRGEWEGRLFEDVERDEPAEYARWMADDPSFRFPGGESLADLQARVLAALDDIRAAGPLPALVVCHGGPIRTVLCEIRGTGLSAFHSWEVPNTAVVRV
ncbi:MAG TPA: histidine phosphatase family protein [Solirubrobacteraceae bacterium]